MWSGILYVRTQETTGLMKTQSGGSCMYHNCCLRKYPSDRNHHHDGCPAAPLEYLGKLYDMFPTNFGFILTLFTNIVKNIRKAIFLSTIQKISPFGWRDLNFLCRLLIFGPGCVSRTSQNVHSILNVTKKFIIVYSWYVIYCT